MSQRSPEAPQPTSTISPEPDQDQVDWRNYSTARPYEDEQGRIWVGDEFADPDNSVEDYYQATLAHSSYENLSIPQLADEIAFAQLHEDITIEGGVTDVLVERLDELAQREHMNADEQESLLQQTLASIEDFKDRYLEPQYEAELQLSPAEIQLLREERQAEKDGQSDPEPQPAAKKPDQKTSKEDADPADEPGSKPDEKPAPTPDKPTSKEDPDQKKTDQQDKTIDADDLKKDTPRSGSDKTGNDSVDNSSAAASPDKKTGADQQVNKAGRMTRFLRWLRPETNQPSYFEEIMNLTPEELAQISPKDVKKKLTPEQRQAVSDKIERDKAELQEQQAQAEKDSRLLAKLSERAAEKEQAEKERAAKEQDKSE